MKDQDQKNMLFMIVLLILTIFFCMFMCGCKSEFVFQSKLIDAQIVGLNNWELTFNGERKIIVPWRNQDIQIGVEYKIYRDFFGAFHIEQIEVNK